MIWIALSFLFFTVMVAVISAWKTRDDKLDTAEGYFLAGRGLPGIVIAGSLLLTNLSAEQLVGTNGQGWASNMSPIGWEVGALFTLFALALWFLPTYLKMGTTANLAYSANVLSIVNADEYAILIQSYVHNSASLINEGHIALLLAIKALDSVSAVCEYGAVYGISLGASSNNGLNVNLVTVNGVDDYRTSCSANVRSAILVQVNSLSGVAYDSLECGYGVAILLGFESVLSYISVHLVAISVCNLVTSGAADGGEG